MRGLRHPQRVLDRFDALLVHLGRPLDVEQLVLELGRQRRIAQIGGLVLRLGISCRAASGRGDPARPCPGRAARPRRSCEGRRTSARSDPAQNDNVFARVRLRRARLAGSGCSLPTVKPAKPAATGGRPGPRWRRSQKHRNAERHRQRQRGQGRAPGLEPVPGSPERDTAAPRRVFIKSYGCQMNVYDAQRMADVLARDGYARRHSAEDADLVVLNTCHIREKAAEKVYSELGRIRVLKERAARAGRGLTVGVAGCVAQAEGEEIIRRAPRRRSRGRPAELSPAARPAGARRAWTARSSTPSSRSRTSSTSCPPRRASAPARAASPRSSPCRRAATSSARSASCPIRAAPKSRARRRRSWPRSSGSPRPACARSR